MCVLNKTLLTFCSTNNLLIFSHFASYCQGTIYVPEGGHFHIDGCKSQIWYHLGCSGQNVLIWTQTGITYDYARRKRKQREIKRGS